MAGVGVAHDLALMTPTLPQWLATLLLAIVLISATEAAFRLARRAFHVRPDLNTDKESSGAGIMLSGALALLGLLIGFTFSMASDRFDARRGMVNEEANAISTAYLRSRLTVGPDRSTLPTQWANYAETRLELARHRDVETEVRLLDRAGSLQHAIWAAVQRETAVARDDITASLVDATNNAFDIAGSRRTAVEARIPGGVIWTVIVYAVVASVLLGYALAFDRRRFFMSSVLLTLVGMSIGLIIDLDRPQSGMVRVSQAPMERTVADIRAWESQHTAPSEAAPAP